MGTVYRAHHEGLDIDVAVKFIHKHLLPDDEAVGRFHHETWFVTKMLHPNIVQVFETGRDETGRQYIVMELLDGEPLRQKLKRGSIPEGETVHIVKQVLQGLEEVHKRFDAHRDIKPSSIFLTASGQAKIADSGFARGIERSRLDDEGTLIGTPPLTPEYMSPEQVEGKPVDARTDLYSLGIVLYEMLTGDAPFTADYGVAVQYMQVHMPPPALPATISPWLRAVVEGALAKNPANRFAGVTEMLDALGPTHA